MSKTVIVTGASTGIGKDCASRLAQRGFRVLAGVRKQKDADAWSSDPGVVPLLLDVAKEDSVRAAVEAARPLLDESSAVHLVNNAGIAIAGPVETVPLSRWEEQFAVNVFGLVRVTQAFLPFIRQSRGRIVNMSSVSGLAVAPYLGPYAASKYAVEAVSDALRRETRQFGVSVAVVEPGPVETPIWNKNLSAKEEMFREMGQERKALYERELNRFLKIVEASARSAVPVEHVSRAVLHALEAPRPRLRYVVGSRGSRIQARLVRFLPDRWIDRMVAKEFR